MESTLNFPWLQYYIGFSFVTKAWLTYLDFRQYYHLKNSSLLDVLKTRVTQEKFEKSVRYSVDKLKFGVFTSAISFGIHIYLYLTYVYVKLWLFAATILPNSPTMWKLPMEYWQSIIFIGSMCVIEEIVSMPFSLYYDFVLEARHGFNRKTLKTFITDKLKLYMIELILGVPIIWILIFLVNYGGRKFYLMLWIFSMVFTLFMMIIYPNFIAPLFNKYEILKNEELKTKIQQMASHEQFPLKKIYQIDASTRSAHSNAYFYGFWWIKYIVLYDTLLDLSHDEILAVLCHELGHWKLNHLVKNLLISFSNLFFTFYFFGIVFFDSNIQQSFGFPASIGRPVIIGLILFMNVYEPITFIVSMFMTILSRLFEFQADAFAAQRGMVKPLQDALIHLNEQNLSTFSVDPLYAWFHYDHPHLIERLAYLDTFDKKKN